MAEWIHWAAIHVGVALAIAAPLAAMHVLHGLCATLFAPHRDERAAARPFLPS